MEWYMWVVMVVLILLSGIFSGLTLGLMGLDTTLLQVIAEGGDEEERKQAKTIMPLRESGNLLLCTLLIGNTLVNTCISIIMADITSGLVGALTATAIIVVVGEITPQAACSRYGLQIGCKLVPLVQVFRFMLLPVAWPISKLLDIVLGQELGTYHSKQELTKLIQIHVEDPKAQEESGLTRDDQTMLTGVLEFRQKRVKDVYTELGKCFSVERSQRLTFEMLLEVYKSGFTRIPVYDEEPDNIVGILYAKDLILVDPDDDIEVNTLLTFHGREVCAVDEDMTLDKVLAFMKKNYNHMLLVEGPYTPKEDARGTPMSSRQVSAVDGGGQDAASASPLPRDNSRRNIEEAITDDGVVLRFANSPLPPKSLRDDTPLSKNTKPTPAPGEKVVTGIVTLEDIIEEIIQDEIVDETDNYVDVNDPNRGRIRHTLKGRDISKFFEALNSDHNSSNVLSPQETQAVLAFLQLNVPEFQPLAQYAAIFKRLIATATVIDEEDDDDGTSAGGINETDEALAERQSRRVLYERGKKASKFVLVMQGKLIVHAGSEGFESELGPWSTLGSKALTADELQPYLPDYTATISGACRLLYIDRLEYRTALRAAKIDHVTAGRRFVQLGADEGVLGGTRTARSKSDSEGRES